MLAGPGCSGEARTPVYPVRGQVKYKGEPASGAFVVFHPIGAPAPAGPTGEEVPRPTALVKPDGSFELTTFTGGDGAPAGDYAVTLRWQKMIYRQGVPEAGPNVIPRDYGEPGSTPLKVAVKPEPNSLPAWDITK
jgi:hypothetical protein